MFNKHTTLYQKKTPERNTNKPKTESFNNIKFFNNFQFKKYFFDKFINRCKSMVYNNMISSHV